MSKKKTDENPADLTEEEQAVEAEMMEDSAEVVAEEEAQGDEALSTDEPKAEEVDGSEIKNREEITPKPEEPDKPEPTTVPLAALDSERHKRKEAEGRLAVLEDKMTTLLAPKPVEPAEDKMPDPVVDPEGFEGWLVRRDARNAQPVHEMTAQMRQQRELNDLRSFATASETTFTVDNADYPNALDFARDLKAQEFRVWGYPEEQIPQLVNFSEAQVAALAKERGVSPAQVVYNYAKLHGYSAEAETKDESPGDKIARLAETQKTTQSTAGAGGTAREDEWTAERIAGLSDKEMAALPDDVFERVMGG